MFRYNQQCFKLLRPWIVYRLKPATDSPVGYAADGLPWWTSTWRVTGRSIPSREACSRDLDGTHLQLSRQQVLASNPLGTRSIPEDLISQLWPVVQAPFIFPIWSYRFFVGKDETSSDGSASQDEIDLHPLRIWMSCWTYPALSHIYIIFHYLHLYDITQCVQTRMQNKLHNIHCILLLG